MSGCVWGENNGNVGNIKWDEYRISVNGWWMTNVNTVGRKASFVLYLSMVLTLPFPFPFHWFPLLTYSSASGKFLAIYSVETWIRSAFIFYCFKENSNSSYRLPAFLIPKSFDWVREHNHLQTIKLRNTSRYYLMKLTVCKLAAVFPPWQGVITL